MRRHIAALVVAAQLAATVAKAQEAALRGLPAVTGYRTDSGRALPVLQQYSAVEVHGMAEAAAAADRVRFGLGVTPADVDTMERFSAWTLDTIWERLSEREQLKAMYRAL